VLELAEAPERNVGESLRCPEIRIWPAQFLGKLFNE
jgi:hypothetical protein